MPNFDRRSHSLTFVAGYGRSFADPSAGASVLASEPVQDMGGLKMFAPDKHRQDFAFYPSRLRLPANAAPCDYAAEFHYKLQSVQDDQLDVVFKLTCSGAGAFGSVIELDTRSNYPEVPIGLNAFAFSQQHDTVEMRHRLPRDYIASLTLKVWKGSARPSREDWIRFEASLADDSRPVVPPCAVMLYLEHLEH